MLSFIIVSVGYISLQSKTIYLHAVCHFVVHKLNFVGFIMQKLSPDMPLQLASDTLLRMFRARVHHHRQGQVLASFFFRVIEKKRIKVHSGCSGFCQE